MFARRASLDHSTCGWAQFRFSLKKTHVVSSTIRNGARRGRESSKAPPDMKTGQSLRTCLSRVALTDHEAQSQVKDEEAAAERKTEDGYAEFKSVGMAARVQCRKEASEQDARS